MTDYGEIETALVKELSTLIDGMILDPSFSYEVANVERIEREPMYKTDFETVFLLTVRTNNRAQLLGQVTPFDAGDYKGYFNHFYSGWLTGYLQHAYSLSERFAVQINAVPLTEGNGMGLGYLDREVSIERAIESGILNADGDLAIMMRKYGLSHLVVGGGAAVAGPLPGPMRAMETLCDRFDIDAILDGFCGSAGLSRVAIENGASHATCIDLDLNCARKNLTGVDNKVAFLETDIFECALPDRSFDIVVLSPYFDLIDEIFANRIEDILERTDRVLLGAGFVSDRFWLDHVERQFSNHVTEIERYDNGRTVHLLGST